MKTLKDRLNWAIENAKVKKAALARACGVKPASVNDWCSGKTKSIKAIYLMRAGKFLGVHPVWLSDGTEPRDLPEGFTDSAFVMPFSRSNPAEGWPFDAISIEKIHALKRDDLLRLEGMLITLASSIGLDVANELAA